MNIDEMKFEDVPADAFGIVLLGCTIDTPQQQQDWVNGITEFLNENEVVTESFSNVSSEHLWESITYSTSTGGRTDLTFIGDPARFNIGRFAMVRIAMTNCSWVEDWLVNYADDYECSPRGPHASTPSFEEDNDMEQYDEDTM